MLPTVKTMKNTVSDLVRFIGDNISERFGDDLQKTGLGDAEFSLAKHIERYEDKHRFRLASNAINGVEALEITVTVKAVKREQ